MGNQQSIECSLILLLFVLVFASGCGNEESTNTVEMPTLHDKTVAHNTLRIVFKWPGDDFASRQDLAIRDKIVDHIRERGVGKVIHVATGMGWMDILIEVEDKDNTTPKLEAIIKETEPAITYTIENLERTP